MIGPLDLVVPAVRTKHFACDSWAEVQEAVAATREGRPIRSLRTDRPEWDPRPLAVGSLVEALEERIDEDACVHFGRVDLGDGDYFYGRLALGLASSEPPPGWSVEVTGCGLDLDNPGHAHWVSREQANARIEGLYELFDEFGGTLPTPTVLYPTPGGLRLLFIFGEPVAPAVAGAVICELHDLYAEQGVENDPAVRQWNRSHRLVYIRREGAIKGGGQ